MKALWEVAGHLTSLPDAVEGQIQGHGRKMMTMLAASILCHFRRAKIHFPLTLFESKVISREEADAVLAEATQLVRGALPQKKKTPK